MQVPGVGEVFYTANPCMGLGEQPLGAEFPAIPCPTRNYDGLEFTFKRRLQNNWMLNASFLYSRIFGTFSGLTSSDESGRNSPSRQPLLRRPLHVVQREGRSRSTAACSRIVRGC